MVEVCPAMSPNYKKGAVDVACWAAESPTTFLQKPGHGCETGAPLSGWPSALPRRVGENKGNQRKKEEKKKRREGEKEQKKPTGGDLVGHYDVPR